MTIRPIRLSFDEQWHREPKVGDLCTLLMPADDAMPEVISVEVERELKASNRPTRWVGRVLIAPEHIGSDLLKLGDEIRFRWCHVRSAWGSARLGGW